MRPTCGEDEVVVCVVVADGVQPVAVCTQRRHGMCWRTTIPHFECTIIATTAQMMETIRIEGETPNTPEENTAKREGRTGWTVRRFSWNEEESNHGFG